MKNLAQIIIITLLLFTSSCNDKNNTHIPVKIKVMSWNIWGKLNVEPKYTINNKTARARVIDIIKDSGADIIGMIETYGSASEIATALNYHYYTPSPKANLTIFSRYPLEKMGVVKDLSPFSFISATVKLPNNKKLRFYNIWLTSGGRHIVDIKNDKIPDSIFNNGDNNRYKHLQQLLQNDHFKADLAKKDSIPLIVAGDFNCVSHLDYTILTQNEGLNYNRILPSKTSKAMEINGFVDTYRASNPTITKETLGYTWTTVGEGYVFKSGEGFVPINEPHPEPEYRNPYARIDFIYCTGKNIKPITSKTISHHTSNKERSFPEFPSDHAAVLSTLEIR